MIIEYPEARHYQAKLHSVKNKIGTIIKLKINHFFFFAYSNNFRTPF